MSPKFPDAVDAVIVGNGPSALVLSYILHGHLPQYVGTHPDPLLHNKLKRRRDLLDATPDVYEHFEASLRYSTQALPINTLLDTLIRPFADTAVGQQSCVEWRDSDPATVDSRISHVILGDGTKSGGQWADNQPWENKAIDALSYAEQLSLPGYSFATHYSRRNHGKSLPDLQRPSRGEVADYYASYPAAVGIIDSIFDSERVQQISRLGEGFLIRPQNIRCKYLVLATGVFSSPPPLPPQIQPLINLDVPSAPLLVIGSGFSAADVITSSNHERKIIHVFQWDPEDHPSPLKGCHRQAYPEYAEVYRHMKLSAARSSSKYGRLNAKQLPTKTRRGSGLLDEKDWLTSYEGLANAEILSIEFDAADEATVQIRVAQSEIIERRVGGVALVIGRRGSLAYLDQDLLHEVLGPGLDGVAAETDADPTSGCLSSIVSGRTLRPKAEADLEMAHSVFAIGSLTGDSLVRHAIGGCTFVAGRIMRAAGLVKSQNPSSAMERLSPISSADVSCEETTGTRTGSGTPTPSTPDSTCSSAYRSVLMPTGQPQPQRLHSGRNSPRLQHVGSTHQDLHIDPRTLAHGVDGGGSGHMELSRTSGDCS